MLGVKGWVGGAAIALVLTTSSLAFADLDFRWEAPASCPTRASVLDAIQRQARSQDSARAEATVTGPPWLARVRVDRAGERGERQLEANTCEELGQAVALIVAMAIDRTEEAPRPPPPPPSPVVQDVAKEAPEPKPSTPRKYESVALIGSFRMQSGLLPSLGPGGAIGVGATTLSSIELSVYGAFFGRSTTAATQGLAGSFFLVTADARAGWRIGLGRDAELVPYAGVTLAYLEGTGRGSLDNRTVSDWLPIPNLGLEARLRLSADVQAFLGADAGMPLGRSTFRFEGATTFVHEPAVISARGSAGLRLALF